MFCVATQEVEYVPEYIDAGELLPHLPMVVVKEEKMEVSFSNIQLKYFFLSLMLGNVSTFSSSVCPPPLSGLVKVQCFLLYTLSIGLAKRLSSYPFTAKARGPMSYKNIQDASSE